MKLDFKSYRRATTCSPNALRLCWNHRGLNTLYNLSPGQLNLHVWLLSWVQGSISKQGFPRDKGCWFNLLLFTMFFSPPLQWESILSHHFGVRVLPNAVPAFYDDYQNACLNVSLQYWVRDDQVKRWNYHCWTSNGNHIYYLTVVTQCKAADLMREFDAFQSPSVDCCFCLLGLE